MKFVCFGICFYCCFIDERCKVCDLVLIGRNVKFVHFSISCYCCLIDDCCEVFDFVLIRINVILRQFYLLKDLADKVQIVHACIHTRGPGTRNACANSIVGRRRIFD